MSTWNASIKVGLSPSKKVDLICFNRRLLKVMKNAFYFMLKALFILKIYNFFVPTLFSHVGKQLDQKVEVNFTIYDVTNWETKDYDTHIAKYLME